jgi:hypothetical protein
MQALINQLLEIAALRKAATPGPWVQWVEHADVYASTPDLENEPHTLCGVRVKIAACEIDDRFDLMGTDEENENGGPYDGEANAAFITAVGNLDFNALATALATQHSPLADEALAELEALEQLATAGPWSINTNPKKWVGNESSDASWAANRDNDAAFVASMRNALPGLLARLRAAEARAYPEVLTPELDKVLGWPNFYCAGFADAFRAAGYDIPRKAEREQAFVLHWVTGLVLKHGAGWQDAASSELAALREKIAVKGEQKNA